MYIGPIGWGSWEVPFLGLALLLLAGLVWVGFDFTRVARTRSDVRRLATVDIDNAKQAVDAAVVGRDFLKSLRAFSIPRPWKDEPQREEVQGWSSWGSANSGIISWQSSE